MGAISNDERAAEDALTPAYSAYQQGRRRMLVDMEIPGWNERFLSEYDPVAMADLYARSGLSSVMFSCKALTGLCFWPTAVGEMHPGIGGRDVIGETVQALRERDIAACAYYSVIYDNWAFETHPEWAIQPIGRALREGSEHDRHGLCCPNNPGYRRYVADQIADLYGGYEFGCAFCDMSFWPGVCGCTHCRERYRAEAGTELPEAIDWTSVEWCTFQSARERWIDEFHGLVTGAMRRARRGIAVYHNFAVGPASWVRGVPFSVTEHSDFLGGDLYGDQVEQLVVTKLMTTLALAARGVHDLRHYGHGRACAAQDASAHALAGARGDCGVRGLHVHRCDRPCGHGESRELRAHPDGVRCRGRLRAAPGR